MPKDATIGHGRSPKSADRPCVAAGSSHRVRIDFIAMEKENRWKRTGWKPRV